MSLWVNHQVFEKNSLILLIGIVIVIAEYLPNTL